MKKTLLLLLFISLIVPTLVQAAPSIKNVGFQDYMSRGDDIKPSESENKAIKDVGFQDYYSQGDDIKPSESENKAIKNVGFDDFMSQSGIQLLDDLKTMEVGQTVSGTIVDVSKVSELGFKDIKAGDKVQLTLLEDGKLKISVVAVKQEKIIDMKK